MAFFAANRVKVSTATTGLSDFVTGAAVSTAFQSFAGASVPDGATVHYTAFTATEFECGEGTYATGTTTLARTTIFASSNGGAKVNFGSGPTIIIAPVAEEVHKLYATLELAADATYDIGTTTVGVNDLHFGSGGVVNFDGGDVTFTHATDALQLSFAAAAGLFTIYSTEAGAGSFGLDFHRDSASPADDDVLASINFYGEDDGSNKTAYATIRAEAADVTGATEDGRLEFDVMNAGSASTALTITGDATYAPKFINTVASFTWNTATSSPANAVTAQPSITTIHTGMRRCVMNDSGVVQYYLDPADSTKKADGTASTLTGADGMVMVEIPKFYTKRQVSGTFTTWSISATPLTGYTLHPAFTKDGVEKDYRYYSAYDACAYDVSGTAYISGLNRDDAVANSPSVDITASTGDILASVSGVFPMVGLTRAEFRTLASNRGTGWRQLDYTLFSAVQLLYLIEHQSFYSQSITGDGNTATTYETQSATQTDSGNSEAGKSNSLGNASTNTTTGASSASRQVAYMSYRGIENFYGNCWNFVDGVIVNAAGDVSADQAVWHYTNTAADFSDSVSTNMTQITAVAATGSEYISAIAAADNFFVPTSVAGGSSSTYLTDYLYGSTSGDRVVRVGGGADDGATVGAFLLVAQDASSLRIRNLGGRLAF